MYPCGSTLASGSVPRLLDGHSVLRRRAVTSPARHDGRMTLTTAPDASTDVTEPRLWKKAGWTARVLRNDDGEGWAVSMTRWGDDEPALVGPWTMGRDKVNPKPLDQGAFMTLVKTASEVLIRHEAAARERMHRTFEFTTGAGHRVQVAFDVAPDDDDPHAMLTIRDAGSGEVVRQGRVAPAFKLSATTIEAFLRGNGH
jgi:hypothetical protein